MGSIIDNNGFYLGFRQNEPQPEEGLIWVNSIPEGNFVKPKYVNNQWVEGATSEEIEASVIVPQEVALWAFRAIVKFQNLEEIVQTKLESLPEPTKTAALFIWDKGNFVERHSPMLNYLASELGLTSKQVDQIFIESSKLIL